MNAADRQRLARLRKRGIVTTETTPAELARLLRIRDRPGPKPLVPGFTEYQRKRFKKLTGKTVNQAAKEKYDA